jgi:hypothetical protein
MKPRQALLRSFALTAFLFGLLVWVYVVAIQITHPEWLYEPFSHVGVFPFDWRLDEVGMFAFGVSAVGFLWWQVQLNMKCSDNCS